MFVPDICSACVSDSYSKNFENILDQVTLAVQFKDILNVFPSHSAVKSYLLINALYGYHLSLENICKYLNICVSILLLFFKLVPRVVFS